MSQPSAVTRLGEIIASGRRQFAHMEHRAAGYDQPHAITQKPPVSSGSMDIRSLYVTPPASKTAQAIIHNSSPIVPVVSKTITLDAAIIQSSRVASLGALVIVAAERNTAYSGTVPLLFHDAGLFRTLEPAQFTLVADSAAATPTATPWHDAPIVWTDAPSIAVDLQFTRRMLKDIGGGDLLEQNLMDAIVLGLARAADACLLAAIVAANRPVFTLAAAAARGLSFGNLGAVIGTNGDGAAVASDGQLRALGVAAALTDTVAKTVIGDWHKAAVAIHPDVQVHIKRLNVDGSLEAVVFANMLPLVPDATAFWTGAA